MLDFLVDIQLLLLLKDNVHIHSSKESQTKLWLFDTLVILTHLYKLETYGPSLYKANNFKDLERHLVTMIVYIVVPLLRCIILTNDQYPTALGSH